MTLQRLRSVASAWTLGVLMSGAVALAQQEEGPPREERAEQDADQFARMAWEITEVVRENHLDPPARREILLAGVLLMLRAAEAEVPADLGERVRRVDSAEALATLLREIQPSGSTESNTTPKLRDTLLQGMFLRIPGETGLISAEDQRINGQLAGNRYVGVGVQLATNKEEPYAQIVNPFHRGAARKAGARPNDLIVEVDGRDAKGVPLTKIVEWSRGAEGTELTYVVRQPGSDERRTLNMVRAVVPIDTVLGYRRAGEDDWSYRVDPKLAIGYLWIRSVNSSTLHELRQAERRMRADGVKAVVLDLRSSHGDGQLHHAELVADGLLDEGLMWRMLDRDGRVREFRSDRECLFRGWPMAVLIDGDMERLQGIVCAALQDRGRAVLVGAPLRADGYVNSLVDLPGGAGSLKLRSGRIERAAEGRAWPVEPDWHVPVGIDELKAVHDWLLAKDLPEPPEGKGEPPKSDPRLAAALDLLRVSLEAPESGAKP